MNKLFKKGVALVASMGVLASTINVTALGASVVNAEFTEAFNWAKEVGVTTTTTEEAFNAFGNVTREQLPKMAINGLNAASCVTLEKSREYMNNFADLASADDSLEDWIVAGYEHGLVNGWDGNYYPMQTVTRAQVMTVIGRALYGQLAEPAAYWTNYYTLLNAEGIFTVENAMAPMKRYELALVLYRIATNCGNDDATNVDDLLCELLGTCDGDNTGDNTDDNNDDTDSEVVVRGDVTVSLASENPENQYITKDKQDVRVMVLDVKAGDEDATIEKLVLNLEGELERGNFKEVAIYNEAGVELDNDTFDSSDEAEFSIDSDDFTVEAGKTAKLYILADMDAASFGTGDGGVFQFAIDADGVEGAASVGGSFPLISNDVVVFNRTSAYSITVEANVPSEHDQFEAGEDVKVVDMTLKNDNNKDMYLHAVTFTSDYKTGSESYDDDLDKILDIKTVTVDGQDVEFDANVDGDKVTITLDEKFEFDENIDVEVEARRTGGEADDAISLVLNETTDIAITEKRTGYNVQVQYVPTPGTDDYDATSGEGGLLAFYTKLGNVESRFDDSSKTPSNGYINFGAQRETIFVGNMTLEKDAEIEELEVQFDGTVFSTGAELIEKVEIYVDGSRKDSADWNDIKDGSHKFDIDETLDAGTYEIEIRIDVTDDDDLADDVDGKTVRAKITSSAAAGSEYTDGDDVAFEGSASGNAMTIKTSGVTVTKTSSEGDDNLVEGANDVNVYTFKIRANDVADIELNKFTVMFSGAALSGASDIDVEAKMGDESKTKSTNSADEAVFSSLDWVIKKGETATVKVYASLPSDIATGSLQVSIKDLELEDNDNNLEFKPTLAAKETFTVHDGATVMVTTNSANPAKLTLVPNANEKIAVMGLEAQNDDVDVSKLLFTLTGLSGVDYATILDNVDLKVDGAVVSSASPETVSTGNYLFFDNVDVRLTKDSVKKFELVAKVADFDSDDIENLSGELSVAFLPESISSDLETRMVAVNVTSSATLLASNNGVTGTFSDTADSVRAAALVANAATATTSLVNGGDIFKFSLTAKGDDAYLSGINISLTPYGVTPLTMNVEDEGGNLVGTMSDQGLVTFTGANAASGYLLSENDTVQFTVIGAVTGVNQGDANIRFILADSDDTVTWGVDGSTFDYNGDDVTGLPTGVTTAN